MVRLECKSDQHFKFWEAEAKGGTLSVHFGRIGTDGQKKDKKFASPAAAQTELEKLVREKLSKGYVKKGPTPAPTARTAKAPRARAGDDKKTAALLALTQLLAPGHTRTLARVKLAIERPDGYATKYAQDLEDRNAEDDPVDPWLALACALDDAGLQHPVDWKDAADEIHACLESVITAQRKLRRASKEFANRSLLAFYDEDAHINTKTLAFLELAGRGLSAHGLALIALDIGSDSYELTILPRKDLARAQELAKKAGGSIDLHGPKAPLKTPLAAAPKARSTVKLEKKKVGYVMWSDTNGQMPGMLQWTGDAPDEDDEKPRDTRKTAVVETSAERWLQKLPIGDGFVEVAVSADGMSKIVAKTHHEVTKGKRDKRPAGTLRIEPPNGPAIDLLERLPDAFDVLFAVWMGDLVVLVPDELTVRRTKSKRPLVWNGKTLAPAKGIPDAVSKGRSFLRTGVARTGDGVDVLFWQGNAYVAKAKSDAFVKTWTLVTGPDEKTIGVPAPGQGFFYVHRPSGKNTPEASIQHAEGGRCVERARLAYRISLYNISAPTPGNGLIVGVNRSEDTKAPVLMVFHPATNEVTYVPAALLGFRGDDDADAWGVTMPKKGDAKVWAVAYDEVRSISWNAVLALPRVPAM